MAKEGQAEVAVAITEAPKGMYEEVEYDESVARGCIKVTEILAYEATKEPRRYSPEKTGGIGEIRKDRDGNILYVEVSRGPYFCQTKEQERVFTERNPGIRTETFGIQLLKSTAIKYLNDPKNVKQFKEKDNG